MPQSSSAFGILSVALFVGVTMLASKARAFSAKAPPANPAATEDVVRRYFDGVNKKDAEQIKSCFAEKAVIRDVCGINDSKRDVQAQDLADRCMDFLAAHPDCKVMFHYGPECGRQSRWVVAHWYETGTWTGESCGIQPTGGPMRVEGQTRFYVTEDLKISDMVVTRTFTEWEKASVAAAAAGGQSLSHSIGSDLANDSFFKTPLDK